MNETDTLQLRTLLERRISVIADHAFRDRNAAAHLTALREVSEAILAEHSRLRSVLPARLNHFLIQSSFSKALDYLNGTLTDSGH